MAYNYSQDTSRGRARSEAYPQRTYLEWDNSQDPIPANNTQPSNQFLALSTNPDLDSAKIVLSREYSAEDAKIVLSRENPAQDARLVEDAPQLHEDAGAMNYLRHSYDVGDHDVSWFEGHERTVVSKQSGSQVFVKRTSTRSPHAATEARREIEIHDKVSDDSIQKLIEWMDGENSIWIVLEYRHLRSIGELVRDAGPFPDVALKTALNQLFLGLASVLLAGFAHLRICADTICIDSNGQLVITDFQYACEYEKGRQGDLYALTQEKYGSDIYVAPEVFAETTYNARKAVIWSCGVLMYFMATGQTDKLSNLEHPSFETPEQQAQESNPPSHRRKLSVAKAQSKIIMYPNRFSVPNYAREVIPKMLVKEPRRRAELIEVASRIPKDFAGNTLRPLIEVAWLDYKSHAGPYADLHAPQVNQSSASSIYSAVSNLSNPFASLLGKGSSRRQSAPVQSRFSRA